MRAITVRRLVGRCVTLVAAGRIRCELRPHRRAAGRHGAALSRLHLPDAVRRPIRASGRICFGSTMRRGAGSRPAISRAPKPDFMAILKRSPQFYPSETALGYLELARKNFEPAAARFDRVLQANPGVRAGARGPRRDDAGARRAKPEALAAFESAVKVDPQLQTIARRVEVLRARAQQENVAAARRAAQANRLDEAAQAVRAGHRRLARQRVPRARSRRRRGEAGENRSGAGALSRASIEMDPTDAASRIRIGEILDARGDLAGAHEDVHRGEHARAERRPAAADGGDRRAAGLPQAAGGISRDPERRVDHARRSRRRSSASGCKPLLDRAPAQAVVITDARNHWASEWIMATATAGVMEAVREPHVPAAQRRAAQRSGAGGRAHAEDHRRRASRSC